MEHHEGKNSLKPEFSKQTIGYRPTPQFSGAIIILSLVAASMFGAFSDSDPHAAPTTTAAAPAQTPTVD